MEAFTNLMFLIHNLKINENLFLLKHFIYFKWQSMLMYLKLSNATNTIKSNFQLVL